jgi:hypothetical protein
MLWLIEVAVGRLVILQSEASGTIKYYIKSSVYSAPEAHLRYKAGSLGKACNLGLFSLVYFLFSRAVIRISRTFLTNVNTLFGFGNTQSCNYSFFELSNRNHRPHIIGQGNTSSRC